MKFALIVSHILDPLWVIPAVTLLQAYKQGFVFTFVVMIFMLIIPLILRLLYTRGRNWDISTRADRPKAIMVLLVLGLINWAIAALWGNPSITSLFMFYEVWMAGYLIISMFWKISGHAGGMTMATGLFIHWYGWNWWPVLLLVPLMGWARVVSKNHTVVQVIAAVLYTWSALVLYEAWQGIL